MLFFGKRIIAIALALCLLLSGMALGETAPANANFWVSLYNGSRMYIYSMAQVGERAYFLASATGNVGLYAYTQGDAEPIQILPEAEIEYWYGTQEQPSGQINLNALFAMDDSLYGLDYYSRQIYRLTDESGQPTLSPMFALGDRWEDEQEAPENNYLYRVFYADGKLYELEENVEGYALTETSLEEGATTRILDRDDVSEFAPYKDGKLLGIMGPSYEEESETPVQIVSYDPTTETAELLYQTDQMDHSNGLCYDADNDTIYYWLGYQVYALPGTEGAVPYVCAYMPEQGGEIGLLANDQLILKGYSGVYLRTPSQGDAPAMITVAGEYGSSAHLAAMLEHPELTIAIDSASLESLEKLTTTMVSENGRIDVLKLALAYQPVERLIEKGYAADLTQFPEVMAVAEQMDPRFLAPFQKDGKLYALPVEISVQSIMVDSQVWTETLGLSLEELPTTFMEYLDFIANYSYDYGEDYEDVVLIDSWDLRRELISMALQSEAIEQMAANNATLNFDTPRLHKALEAIEAIDYSDISISSMLGENPTDDDYEEYYSKTPLFSPYYTLEPGSFGPDYGMIPVIMAMDEDSELRLSAEISVLMINPKSESLESAAAYLASYASHLEPTTANIQLFPGHNDPVLSPDYEDSRRDFQDYLARRQKALETASEENKAALQDEIAELEKELENFEQYRILISQQMIDDYWEKVGAFLYPLRQTPLTDYSNGDNSVNALVEQFNQGAMDADTFIRELNNRVRLMQLENQ